MADLDLQTALQHHQSGRLADAEKIYRQILARNPQDADALQLLGALAGQCGQVDAAIDLIRRALSVRPDYLEALRNLASLLAQTGRLEESIEIYKKILAQVPDDAMVYFDMGVAFRNIARRDETISSDSLPTPAGQGHFEQAIDAVRKAIQLKPDFTRAHTFLAAALSVIGEIDQSIASHRQAAQLNPDSAKAAGNLLVTLHYHPGYGARMIREELRRWNHRHAEPFKKFIQPHTNTRDPGRPLRIGYLSPDFRDHVVGRNLLPLFREHDRRQFEIFCYSNVLHTDADAYTEEFQRHVNAWRDITRLSDSQAVDLIRQDRIDILVDLTLHATRNRVLIFAYKPAPVQVTYLAYCSSSGLDTMDYRLSDPYLDPPDSDLSVYSEQTICLPATYWCYNTGGPTPEPSPPPVEKTGHITFGSLNNFTKISPALDLWAEILQRVPRSRLIVHSPPGTHLEAVRKKFSARGVAPDRLEFPPRRPWPEYVLTYNRIDIALDPFPWGGGITTCDALWMGVPVVTLVGQTAVGRGGASILSNIGLPELIARSPQEYVEIAANLSGNLPRLSELRRTLRPRLQASPLMDAPRFARDIEAAYRRMWRNWCTETNQLAINAKSV